MSDRKRPPVSGSYELSWVRRTAMAIMPQLPEDPLKARQVLEEMRRLIDYAEGGEELTARCATCQRGPALTLVR